MRNILLAALISLLVGGLTGWHLRGKSDKADQVDAVVEVQKQTVKQAIHAQEGSVALQTHVDEIRDNTDGLKKEAVRHVPVRPNTPTGPGLFAATAGLGIHPAGLETSVVVPPEIHLAYGGDRLLMGAVCVLNAARAGEDPGAAASRCDEEGETPSTVDISQLLEIDLDTVGRYNALMAQHNALIDYVEEQQKDAAQ